MADTQVRMDFITQYDSRALSRAQKDMAHFRTNLKSLARAFGVTFSVGALVAYSKASVKAANQDAKSQRLLANELANVGLSFEKIRVENFISKLEQTTGILDDELRPAFAQLLRVTGSVTKTQELLGVAFDAGAGSGIGFSAAVDVLSKAYVGNYKSVRQLNLGLTQQELKTISVTKLIGIMKDKFKNAGSESVTALDLLSVGLANIQEQFGYGLTDSSQTEIDKQNLQDLIDPMKKLAYYSGRVGGSVLKGAGSFFTTLKKYTSKEGLFNIFGGFSTPMMGALASIKTQTKVETELEKKKKEWDAARRKAEDAAIKRAKEIAAQQKTALLAQQKATALQKLSNLLRQAQKVFDNEAITLAAAAQGKLTEEERARLKLKQDIYDLDAAIKDENITAATAISQTLVQDAQYLGQITGLLTGIDGVKNPFAEWLKSLEAILAALKIPQLPSASNPYNLGVNAAGYATQNGQQIMPTTDANNRVSSIYNYPVGMNPYRIAAMADGGIVTSAMPAIIGEAGPEAVIPLSQMGSMGSTIVNVTVQGSVTTERDLVAAITQGIYNNQASGTPITYSTKF